MKSVRFYYRKKFDDQYTFELESNLTIHEFHAIMALFNQVAKRHPPPTSRMYYMMGLFMLWMVAFTVFYYVWIKFHASYILLGLPVFMLLTSFILAWISKRRMIKFENEVLQVCSRLNATENIRGINFRFTRDGLDITHCRYFYKPNYAIDIEMDERFTALNQFHQSNISVPTTAFTINEKQALNMFEYINV
ncbi:hypothetical protein BCV72DRAFT_20515 [Rhizopus microsporus var. microsporus]|nr:hypothetical protein BCV72DRAFT_20515 [Rhizopus microsporus var. microsporus]